MRYVIRAGGKYWGEHAVTGRPGWTWAVGSAKSFDDKTEAEIEAGNAARWDRNYAGPVEVIPDPRGSKW